MTLIVFLIHFAALLGVAFLAVALPSYLLALVFFVLLAVGPLATSLALKKDLKKESIRG
jgi:hypothetical protein